MIILAGLLPNPSVSVDTTGIFLSLSSVFYMFPFGIAGRQALTSHHSSN